ncbi:MAG: hypothetical protein QF363_22185 [Planctomycetaceae bacterium]|jgi:hypothetical protein|nr:hypothetical protein [Planctomycetaceae bacterium]
MLVSLILGLLAGCGRQGPPPELITARNHLQQANPQAAIDSLDGLPGDAAAHYLRAVALMQLDRPDAARTELQAAITQDATPRRVACLLRLRLFARDLSAADELIAMELAHPSNAAVRLACVYAYEARAVRLSTEGKHASAAAHHRRAADSLSRALADAADIPEFHPELLDFAENYGLAHSGLKLVRLMQETVPHEATLDHREIRFMLSVDQIAQATRLARRLHLRSPSSGPVADLYAQAIAEAPASKSHDRSLRELRRAFPGRLTLIAHHARYLASNHRLTSACQILSTALSSKIVAADTADKRALLVQAAIVLPLEAGAIGLAEQQLNRYRSEFSDELIVTYYEGQLLHLQEDYEGAIRKMTAVLRARAGDAGRRDPLVTDAVRWLAKIRQAKSRTPAST